MGGKKSVLIDVRTDGYTMVYSKIEFCRVKRVLFRTGESFPPRDFKTKRDRKFQVDAVFRHASGQTGGTGARRKSMGALISPADNILKN